MRKGAMLLALLVLGATAVQAQTTTHINVNVGDPAFATFYMRTTGSEVGDTVSIPLRSQCLERDLLHQL